MLIDDRDSSSDDESLDNDDVELEDTDDDEDAASTDNVVEREKPTAEEVREKTKLAWLKKIDSGEKTLDDIPANLGWLKKEITAKPESSDLSSEIRKALQEERAVEEFDILYSDLNSAEITAEQESILKEEYENYLSDFQKPTATQQVKALKVARRLAGLESNSEKVRSRRIEGMKLPALSNRSRTVKVKEVLTEAEKRLAGNLPPGFEA